jgi:hypothetical protein
MYEEQGPSSSAYVDIRTGDNVTWLDAFQFGTWGPCGCTGATGPNWQLTGTFQWDIVANNWNGASPEPSLSLSSNGGTGTVIVVDDPINLVLNANVPPSVLTGATATAGATGTGLLPGVYKHALRMTQGSNVIELLHGWFHLSHGV